MMLACVQNEHPGNVTLPMKATVNERAALQSMAQGYTMALSNLLALAKYEMMPEPIEATFPDERPTTD